MYGNSHAHIKKLMCCQPQPCESTNIERKLFQLHLMQWDPFVTYEKHMIKLLRAESCSKMNVRGFLLKGYWENHKPEVDGKADHCISMPIKTSYTGYFHLCINTDVFHIYTTKSVVSLKKDYKILWYPSKIVQLFSFNVYIAEKHM